LFPDNSGKATNFLLQILAIKWKETSLAWHVSLAEYIKNIINFLYVTTWEAFSFNAMKAAASIVRKQELILGCRKGIMARDFHIISLEDPIRI